METAPGVPPPATPVPAGRPFSAGEVIGRSFSVWFGNFAPFSIVTLIVNLPVFALVALAPVEERSVMDALANLVSAFANLVVTGALTFGVLQTLNGAPVPLGTLLKKGFAKVGSVLLVSFGYGLIVFLGILLLVVPGVIAMCALYVAIPAVVVEDVGPGEALGRSRALTKGSRWGILAVALVVGVVTLVAAGVAGVAAVRGTSALPHPIPALVSSALMVFATPLGACAAAVAYHDLRVAKEGVDTAALVKVFE